MVFQISLISGDLLRFIGMSKAEAQIFISTWPVSDPILTVQWEGMIHHINKGHIQAMSYLPEGHFSEES